ncbi:MAG: pole-localized protein SpbR [Phenylobacterium sp.]|uniref:Pole-localized protein SpbR n=1 Tax=Phenylobacterium ferrooxidans TaxID=2982689 RepID=A0ABW6CQE8_9CAUL|nr:pole-localized protein SpbR [Phenylobacterium sp.]MDO8322937.1 pole-localized protein SpbR [Phenylobacterium sp.]MDO8914128.1 pole-localized protein SpbR [Phenylobacterium sp.]MDO9247130.1 pole-localized protein SpbR [Phenylobacterium sp.]MDP2009821.1 pole-localized protein SpbR [Phenylobacterium sp.]MDP3101450.1 pole-localized protein SpbR [Phenylobacterium sp.]
MATTRAALTDEDIRTLVKGATPDERAVAAHKLCRNIDRYELSDEERVQAQEILRVMAADAGELVRRALAVTLKNSTIVPRDVALRLAKDVESISLPMLSSSPVFTDEDLAEIVRLGGPVRQVVIAKRPRVSQTVTNAIVEYGVERAVEAACANDNADFADRALAKVIERFEKSERVLAAVAYRAALPLAVTEKLIDLVSEEVRDHLLNHHALSPDLALEIAMGAKERATIDLVDQAGRAPDVKSFVAHLHKHERLNASLLLRSLAHGHMTFFEWSLAELASVPHHRTWLMIHDAGPLGLRAIYERAGLPARLFPAFRAGVDTFHSMEFDGGARDRERFQERMLQRFLTQPANAAREDVEYLLEKMDRITHEARKTVRLSESA